MSQSACGADFYEVCKLTFLNPAPFSLSASPHLLTLQALNHNAGSGYSAPEVAMSGQYTINSDVYSFGVVMLELLTGRKPFDR